MGDQDNRVSGKAVYRLRKRFFLSLFLAGATLLLLFPPWKVDCRGCGGSLNFPPQANCRLCGETCCPGAGFVGHSLFAAPPLNSDHYITKEFSQVRVQVFWELFFGELLILALALLAASLRKVTPSQNRPTVTHFFKRGL
jgi:hypothetical protein